jgi:hypothetical protein
MKTLKTCALGVLLTLCYLHSAAQDASVPLNEPDYNKPKLFSDLPQRIYLKIVFLEALFDLPVGTNINTQVSEAFSFTGTVVSKSNVQDASIKSIVIRSANRPGAVFTFSRAAKPDGSFSYNGRIMSRNHSDAYEVKQEKGVYVLNKISLYDLINE